MPAELTRATPLSALERIYATFSPCVFGPSLLASYLGGASAAELRARRGWLPAAAGPKVWLHGASAGEMAAAARLVTALRGHGYHFQAVFTAANRAGVEYIARRAAPGCVAALAPWDVPAWISRAFDLWQPAVLMLIETELWPRLVFEAHRRRVPALMLSARIYPKDVARYRAIRSFIAPTIARLSRILAQDEIERERFLALGADARRCIVAGNLKHLEEPAAAASSADLRRELGLHPTQPIMVFGSVHQSEIALVLEAIKLLETADTRFIIAPRHLAAAGSIAHEAAMRGLRAVRRSYGQLYNDWKILILDTMGELGNFYSIATAAVVCGGFAKFGGHNPYEALQAGAPVLFGPHFDHFANEAAALAEVTPEARVADAAQIAARLGEWRCDERARRRAAALQRRTLPDAAAVTRRYLSELTPYLVAVHE